LNFVEKRKIQNYVDSFPPAVDVFLTHLLLARSPPGNGDSRGYAGLLAMGGKDSKEPVAARMWMAYETVMGRSAEKRACERISTDPIGRDVYWMPTSNSRPSGQDRRLVASGWSRRYRQVAAGSDKGGVGGGSRSRRAAAKD
jgi:hypothetical protein